MVKKKQFPLRIDPELYKIIARWAEDELRSINGHIEYLLREAAIKHGRMKKEKNEENYYCKKNANLAFFFCYCHTYVLIN